MILQVFLFTRVRERDLGSSRNFVLRPANAPHSFTNASDRPARLLCVCSPAGQERFFLDVGVRVGSRTEAPPELDEAAQAEFVARVQELAPWYRSELLGP